MAVDRLTLRQCLITKVRSRGLEKSICPSEVAREMGGDEWRSLMPLVREIGAELVQEGSIIALQQGNSVDPLHAKGPIRFQVTQRGMQ
jgi:hypothetical protein